MYTVHGSITMQNKELTYPLIQSVCTCTVQCDLELEKYYFETCFSPLLVAYICSRDLHVGWDSFDPFAKKISRQISFITSSVEGL